MSARARPPEGPDAKSPAWRGGSWSLGLAVILLIVNIFAGVPPLGWVLILAAVGVAMSFPWGSSWLAGTAKDRSKEQYLASELPGQAGATYIVLQKDAVRPRAPKRDYTGGALVAHSLVWRMPVIWGDMLLSTGWGLAGRVQGRDKTILRYEDELRAFNEEEEREKRLGRDY